GAHLQVAAPHVPEIEAGGAAAGRLPLADADDLVGEAFHLAGAQRGGPVADRRDDPNVRPHEAEVAAQSDHRRGLDARGPDPAELQADAAELQVLVVVVLPALRRGERGEQEEEQARRDEVLQRSILAGRNVNGWPRPAGAALSRGPAAGRPGSRCGGWCGSPVRRAPGPWPPPGTSRSRAPT